MSFSWRTHFGRRFFAGATAIVLAAMLGYFVSAEHWVWAVFGSMLVMPTTRGTPTRQGLVLLLLGFLAVSASSFFLYAYWGVGWTPISEQLLQTRLTLLILGGLIAIIASIFILPVRQYYEFCQGLIMMLDALSDYSADLERVILHGGKIEKSLLNITYPEWVFETGFNRNFRGSFRYVLIQLDKIIESFFSIDFYIQQPIDADLRSDIADKLALVVNTNAKLLRVMRAFFANEKDASIHDNYISDMTALRNIVQAALPDSLELLDVSPDYTMISSLVRDVIDIREILLQMLAGLPIDELAVNQT